MGADQPHVRREWSRSATAMERLRRSARCDSYALWPCSRSEERRVGKECGLGSMPVRSVSGWERPSRTFAANGADPPPRWSDFADPLDAIATRFGRVREPSRFNKAERQALSVLGLGEDADRHSLRQTYSTLVRRYHPDKNGGDR